MNKKMILANLDENICQKNEKIGIVLSSDLFGLFVGLLAILSFFGVTFVLFYFEQMVGESELPGWMMLISFTVAYVIVHVFVRVINYFSAFKKLSTDECGEVADLIQNIEKCKEHRDMVLAIPRSLRKLDLMIMQELKILKILLRNCY